MVTVKLIQNTNGGLEYLFRACRYVDNTERAIYIHGFGVNPYDLNDAYDQMLGVKRYFGKTSGNPLAHFVVSFDESVREPWRAIELGQQIAAYFTPNYQLMWCIHQKHQGDSYYHMHMALNSVSYVDGRMFHCGIPDMNAFGAYVREVTGCRVWTEFENKSGRECRWETQ